MRFVALCYDVIRSDATVPIVEAIVLIGEIFLAAKLSRLTSRHMIRTEPRPAHDKDDDSNRVGIGVGVNATLQCVYRFRVLSSSGSRDLDVQTIHQR